MQIAEVQLLGSGAPQNVTQSRATALLRPPANSPGSEGVANAIDGTQTKYLNFDTRNGKGLLPSGFAVTPSVGDTLVMAMRIQTANDAPERDPKHVTIEGSNDDTLTNFTSGNWTMIADLQVPAVATRYAWQTVTFPNLMPFKHYRWTVLQTATANDCCMQVAEVQLLAVTAKADCGKAAFVLRPEDTPVLQGSQLHFLWPSTALGRCSGLPTAWPCPELPRRSTLLTR